MNTVEAAHVVIGTILEMANEGSPLMTRILPDEELHWWRHYPEKDARDRETQSRWYYHVHPPGDRDAAEHGHFHLFLHRSQMDAGTEPIATPKKRENGEPVQTTHLIGLAINHQGIPMRWFSTNRWVTDEYMYPAREMVGHINRFNVDNTQEDSTVNRFVTAMVALYREEIAALLRERDVRLTELGASPDDPEIYEKGNDVLSSVEIDLDAKIESLGID